MDKRAYIIIGDEVFEEDEDGVERINLTKEQFNQSIVNILKKPTEFINSHKKIEKDNLLTIIGNREDEFSNVKIFFNNRVIDKIIINSKNSDILILSFLDFKFDIKIDDSLFLLKNKTK